MPSDRAVVVLSDSESLRRDAVTRWHRMRGLEPLYVSTSDDLFAALREEPVVWMALDAQSPATAGAEGRSMVEAILPTVAQQQEEDAHTPLVVLAREDDADFRVRLLEAGVDALVSPGPLLERELFTWLRRFERARARALSRAPEFGDSGRTFVLHPKDEFLLRLNEAFRRAQRYDEPIALAVISFSRASTGDEAESLGAPANTDGAGPGLTELQRQLLAHSLRDVVRDTDVCGLLSEGRIGLALPRTHLAGALTVSERLVRHIGARVLDETGLRGEARVGLGGFPQRSLPNSQALLATTEQALLHLRRGERRMIAVAQDVERTAAD